MTNRKNVRTESSDGVLGRPEGKPDLPPPKIPRQEFIEAKNDPTVAKFLESIKVEDERLKSEGKIHP